MDGDSGFSEGEELRPIRGRPGSHICISPPTLPRCSDSRTSQPSWGFFGLPGCRGRKMIDVSRVHEALRPAELSGDCKVAPMMWSHLRKTRMAMSFLFPGITELKDTDWRLAVSLWCSVTSGPTTSKHVGKCFKCKSPYLSPPPPPALKVIVF